MIKINNKEIKKPIIKMKNRILFKKQLKKNMIYKIIYNKKIFKQNQIIINKKFIIKKKFN